MELFVARQPILDGWGRLFAYELLFRSGPENYFAGGDAEATTAHVISRSLLGLHDLTGGKPAFINFGRATLVGDFGLMLPSQEVVIEILESVQADEEVLTACRRLKDAGYRIALDDFTDLAACRPFVPLADFIKVDLLATEPREVRRLASAWGSNGPRMLAEKVETREAFDLALLDGYQFFQGFYFQRPTVVATRAIPAFRLNYLRILEELSRPGTDLARLEELIKREASITYRLLRRVNSLAFGFRTEIESLRHALVLLGLREIRACTAVWCMAELGRDTPSELVVASSIRGRMAEMLAAGLGDRASDFFLAGLFSLLDAVMGQPMASILADLPVSSAVRDALLGRPNLIRTVLDIIIAHERGLWPLASAMARKAGVEEAQVAVSYLEAVAWADDIFTPVAGAWGREKPALALAGRRA